MQNPQVKAGLESPRPALAATAAELAASKGTSLGREIAPVLLHRTAAPPAKSIPGSVSVG